MPQPASGEGWQPTGGELAGLDAPGRQFIRRLLEANDAEPHEGPLILSAAVAHDGLSRVRSWQRRARTMVQKLALERLVVKWQVQLSRALFALRRSNDEAEGEDDDYNEA